MTATKTTILRGLEVQPETTYGDGGPGFTPASDGVLLSDETEVTLNYLREGSRALAVGSAGILSPVSPSGYQAEVPFSVEMRGNDAVYTAPANIVKDLHHLLLASGHSATHDATPSSEKWTFAPVSSAFDSAAVRMFGRGQQFDISGVYCDFNFELDATGASFALAEFPVMGLAVAPVDAGVPGTLVYDSHLPPRSQNIALTIGSYTGGVVRRVQFQKQQQVISRGDLNGSSGHAGFAMGRRDPQLVIEIEAEAYASPGEHTATAYDPYNDWDNATARNVTFTVGATQYNRFTFTAAQAVLVNVEEGSDDIVATWTLTYKLPISAGGLDDDYTLVFD